MGSLDVVREGEEGVRAQGHALHLVQPGPLFLSGKYRRFYLEDLLPCAFCQHIHVLFPNININGVVPVRSADAVYKLQAQYLGALAQPPVVRLLAGQSGAVYTGLLSGADADGLSVFHKADRVGLGVFQGNQGDLQISQSALRQILVLCHNVGQQGIVDGQLLSSLLKADAENLLVLQGSGNIVLIDLDHAVVAVFLGFQDFQSLLGISGGDDAVGNLSLNERSGIFIADIGQRNKISEGGHSVRASGSGVSAGQGRQLAHIVHPVDLPQRIIHGKSHSGSRRGNMLKGGGRRKAGGFLQLSYQLPAVEGIQEVDVSGASGKHLDGQFASVSHVDPGRFLIGVASVL